MIKKIALTSLLASALTLTAQADTTKDDALVTHTELGYIGTTGNTKTTTFNIDTNVKKGFDKHIFKLLLDGQYGSDNDIASKNKYYLELTYDYKFTDRLAFSYIVGYKRDKFSAFHSQFFTGPGIKDKIIISDTHNLTLEGSILYSSDDYYDPAIGTDNYSAYRAKGTYDWQMLKNLKFEQELSYRGSFDNVDKYFVYSKSAFASKISDMFSAGISYKVDYVNQAGTQKHTDTTLTANLIMDY